MTNSEIFKAAHALAKATVEVVGDYAVALKLALQKVHAKKNFGFIAVIAGVAKAATHYAKSFDGFIAVKSDFAQNGSLYIEFKKDISSLEDKFAFVNDFNANRPKSFGRAFHSSDFESAVVRKYL